MALECLQNRSLGVVPANFSDALFNSREPVADWRAYVYLIWDIADGGFFEGW